MKFSDSCRSKGQNNWYVLKNILSCYRINFHKQSQLAGESVKEFAAELRRLTFIVTLSPTLMNYSEITSFVDWKIKLFKSGH